ncbi:hypothetical protein [Geomonas sp.]|uniref:hypothetical protein n=1 Tax=Geomonas sp. TaxID=2651584 RepID=UPI002B46EA21|nr:hypothetical protein [Geomonas sp.]HJV33951.1 hypothetical protein [Geomonas sp.]
MTRYEELWREGVRRVTAGYALLSRADREQVDRLCRSMVARKEAMQALVARVDAASHCAGCGGACCVKGKYHVTPVDLVVYLATGAELFAPLFDNGLCPYLAPEGCLMPPGYRPFNCITFNCELIEDQLPEEEVALFYLWESELRESYRQLRALFPDRSADGPLLKD